MSNYIKDDKGRMIGSIKTEGNKTTARDFSGKMVATYNSNTNTTWDIKNNKTIKGNVAIMMLKK
jgi:hypothetical protein